MPFKLNYMITHTQIMPTVKQIIENRNRQKAVKNQAKKRKNKKRAKVDVVQGQFRAHQPMLVIPNQLSSKPKEKKIVKQRSSVDPTIAMAREYVAARTEPRLAALNGLTPAPPDYVNKPLYRFSTTNEGVATSVANGATVDIFIIVNPFGGNLVGLATAFAAGLPSSFAGGTSNATGYANWGSNFPQIRMVACELEVWNSTKVSDETGVELMCNIPSTEATSYTFSTLSAQPYAALQPANDLKAKRITWTPIQDDTVGDFALKVPGSTAATYPNATCMVFWQQGGVGQSYTYRVTAHWEAEIFMNLNSFMRPRIKASSWEETQRLSYRLNSVDPAYGEAHVRGEDSKFESSVLNGRKSSKFRRISNILGEINLKDIASAALGFIGAGGSGSSWFGLKSHDRIERIVGLMSDEDVGNLLMLIKDAPAVDVLASRLRKANSSSNQFVFLESKSSSSK